MVKLLYFVKRRPGMSVEEFHKYWGTNHAAMIRKHAKLMGIVKYHQSHALPDPRNAATDVFPERFDGVAEVWFESKRALDGWFKNETPAAKAAGKEIRDDERKFADRAHSPFLIAEDVTVIEG